MNDFTGLWLTTFGPLEITQEGERAHGVYRGAGGTGTLEGAVVGNTLTFHYEEPAEQGEGYFERRRYGQFSGRYRPTGLDRWFDWQGSRLWDGVWETSFGRLRLFQEPDRIHGFYEGLGPSTLEGRLEGGRLVFQYREPAAQGEGWFELSGDARSFAGQWHLTGSPHWADWLGRRVPVTPRLTWLIVLEAHWQLSFADREYSFGNMIKEFFARLDNVAVRHRIFNDEASLERWCRELMYFPEPAVVLIASHGTPGSLSVHGRSIDTDLVLDYLRHASNITLLHFSSCLVMKEEQEGAMQRRLSGKASFPVSGYTTSVDWGGSAILEFNYLDLILSKGLSPAQAAEWLPRLVSYAGDIEEPGTPYAPAGFRFFAPPAPPALPEPPAPPPAPKPRRTATAKPKRRRSGRGRDDGDSA
jgi:hypothetical protein